MIREAILLAGGLGTRLRSAVPDLPKCMAPVAGRPFLAHLIDHCLRQGVESFIFSLGYKHETILRFLADEYPSLEAKNFIEKQPLGTGGAVKAACALVQGDQVLIMNGDTLFDADLAALCRFHMDKRSACTLALKPMKDSDRYGVVEMDDQGRIQQFREKNWYAESLINGGVYALDKEEFLSRPLPHKFSFEKDYLEKYSSSRRFFGFVQDKYFIDIGVPEDFQKAQIELPLQHD